MGGEVHVEDRRQSPVSVLRYHSLFFLNPSGTTVSLTGWNASSRGDWLTSKP